MSRVLHIEFFDTDASSYRHRLKFPLKTAHSFRVEDKQLLAVEHEDGTTRFVPLANVKQFYEGTEAAESNPTSA